MAVNSRQSGLVLIAVLMIGSCTLISGQGTPSSCKVHSPSEYSYFVHSVDGTERTSANCRITQASLPADTTLTTDFAFSCDGAQLRLADSDLGSEPYSSSDYYVWSAGVTVRRMLFTLPERVNLTGITLHYFSDSNRGLSRILFYAVPDDFKLGDGVRSFYNQAIVETKLPSNREQNGPTNFTVNLDFNTKKVLMLKILSNFQFALSEVEFFTCNESALTESNMWRYPDQTRVWNTSAIEKNAAATTPPEDVIIESENIDLTTMISVREAIAWTLAAVSTVLFFGFLTASMIMLCLYMYKKRQVKGKMESPTMCEMEINPSYEIPSVSQTRDIAEVQEYPFYERINQDITDLSTSITESSTSYVSYI